MGQALRERRPREDRLKVLRLRKLAITAGCSILKGELEAGVGRGVTLRQGLLYVPRELEEREVDPALDPQRQSAHPRALAVAVQRRVGQRPPLGRLVHRHGAAVPLIISALGIAGMRGWEARRSIWTTFRTVERDHGPKSSATAIGPR